MVDRTGIRDYFLYWTIDYARVFDLNPAFCEQTGNVGGVERQYHIAVAMANPHR
jgi:hypothetical protein